MRRGRALNQIKVTLKTLHNFMGEKGKQNTNANITLESRCSVLFDGLVPDQHGLMSALETSQGLFAQNLQTNSVESFLSHFSRSSVNKKKSGKKQ